MPTVQDFANELFAVYSIYQDIGIYQQFLHGDEELLQTSGANYFLSKEFKRKLSEIPEEILRIFPINAKRLEEKSEKILEGLIQ